jgi:pimeloyl-ACP methyl ester carboxylesterase
MKDRPDSSPLLGAIACPTLVVVGEHDALTPPDVSRDMQARIAGATLEILPDAGHMSNLENPDAFNRALARFLDEV